MLSGRSWINEDKLAMSYKGESECSPLFFSMPLSLYCIQFDHPESSDQVILFSTRTAATVALTRDALKDLERNALPVEEKENLAALGLIVRSTDEEKREMLAYVDEMNKLNASIRPVVVMNLDCNLACAYCFEGTRKGKYYLSEETSEDLVTFIDKQLPGKNEICPTFYGGEPLLNAEMIASISERLRSLADRRGAAYAFTMITNGTLLTRHTAERLKCLGLRNVTVTLDGPPEVHDSSRPFKSGSGSFDTIVRNLRDVCDLIEVNIGGNYTRENYRVFPRLFDALLNEGLGPRCVSSVEFSPVFNETTEFVPHFRGGCASTNEAWIAEAGVFLRQEILSRGYRTPAMQPAVCMIEWRDRFVVNWDGGLYKCPNLIGRKNYCMGSVKSGILDYNVIHNLGNWKNESCLSCCYLPLCFGGCRFMNLTNRGAAEGVDCKKDFFDRCLEALVLQEMIYPNTVTT